MTLMELTQIAFDLVSERIDLDDERLLEFQQIFVARIEQCEQLEMLKDCGDGPQAF